MNVCLIVSLRDSCFDRVAEGVDNWLGNSYWTFGKALGSPDGKGTIDLTGYRSFTLLQSCFGLVPPLFNDDDDDDDFPEIRAESL